MIKFWKFQFWWGVSVAILQLLLTFLHPEYISWHVYLWTAWTTICGIAWVCVEENVPYNGMWVTLHDSYYVVGDILLVSDTSYGKVYKQKGNKHYIVLCKITKK